jgi:hypothetical protein
MHGVDWIITDESGHIFIESKTKRLTLNSRILPNTVALNNDLAIMATAIVQHYRNIRDAIDGKTKWKPDRLPIFPLVLTLEDWFIFSPRVTEMLNKHVRRKLAEAQIPENVLDEMPYTIASAHEFEIAIQIIAQLNIYPVMSKKTGGDQRMWSLLPFIMNEFKEQMRSVDRFLFAADWETLMPQMPDGTTFDQLRRASSNPPITGA